MIYVVRGRKGPDSPVYMVEPSQGEGRKHVLHRNLLLPCPYLVERSTVTTPNLKEVNNRTKAKRTVRTCQELKCDTYPTDTDSSSEDECLPLNADAEGNSPQD